MGVNYFTNEQVDELRCNPYVDNVSTKAITYSEEFKRHFIEENQYGKLPTQIFREAGFNPKVLGKMRINNFARRVRKMNERVEGFTDLRSESSGRPRTKERTIEAENAYLRHQVALQKQQIDVLKKTNSINRKAAKDSHKKNSNSSKQ
ncbi:MAG: hypothetical protein LBS33_02845 [Streptococcaceae bacterium]|jgi:hypothetical protein|nr:hypothetical protein [Streptococcaceae bacterium]